MNSIQYSVRGVSKRTDALLREQARTAGISLNQAALDTLQRGLGIDQEPHRYDDLADLAGSWVPDPETDQALAAMDRVDEDLWEMKIAVDTNRYRDFCGGLPETVERFSTVDIICMPFVTLAELRAGFQCGTAGKQNESVLIRFLNRPRIRVLFPNEDTTHHYARLFAQLRKQGTPIPTNDMWIAALVLQHDLLLYSRDAHFDRLPQIPRVN